jgi:hypothetical protein
MERNEVRTPEEKPRQDSSSVATHRRWDRMRTYVQQPRPEARM